MVDTSIIRPLTNSQKLFLQRLMVAHVLSDSKAKELFASIREKFANVHSGNDAGDEDNDDGIDQGYLGNTFENCLGIINASLLPAFNLEICTVSLPPLYDPDNPLASVLSQNSEETPSKRSRKSSSAARPALVKYHALVNRSNDTIAQQSASPLSHRGPHELAYFRLVLEKIVERGLDDDAGNTVNVGCTGAMSRMDLINLRTEMEGPHKEKLTIAQTEMALEMLEREGWVVLAAPPGDDDDESDDNQDDNDDEDQPKKRKKRKSSRPSSSGGNRRKSLRGTFYGVGPRSFMELGDFLQAAGFPQERMPQSILHRA